MQAPAFEQLEKASSLLRVCLNSSSGMGDNRGSAGSDNNLNIRGSLRNFNKSWAWTKVRGLEVGPQKQLP